MGLAQEFKEFAMKGNVVDLAVGVIIGGAFGKIVDSAVKDLTMPIVGRIIGKVDFSTCTSSWLTPPRARRHTRRSQGSRSSGAGLRKFHYHCHHFIILAFIIFMMVKQMNRLKRNEPAPAPPATAEDVLLLREIRDSLKK